MVLVARKRGSTSFKGAWKSSSVAATCRAREIEQGKREIESRRQRGNRGDWGIGNGVVMNMYLGLVMGWMEYHSHKRIMCQEMTFFDHLYSLFFFKMKS